MADDPRLAPRSGRARLDATPTGWLGDHPPYPRRQKLYTIPVLMLTARVEDADKIAGLPLGADDYWTKPFNGGELTARSS